MIEYLKDNNGYRVRASNWPRDCFEIMSYEDFETLKEIATKFNNLIVLVEIED